MADLRRFARTVCRSRRVERGVGLPAAAPGRLSVPEPAAGEILRRGGAGGGTISSRCVRSGAARGNLHASVSARGVFLSQDHVADPSRRFSHPQHSRAVPQAAAAAVAFMDDKFDPSLTMREKVTELTRKRSCMACHATINPLGFSLETLRRRRPLAHDWTTTSRSTPSRIHNDRGRSRSVCAGARDLARTRRRQRDARRGFVRQLFHHTVKQPTAAYGPDTLEKLDDAFVTPTGYHSRNLSSRSSPWPPCHGAEIRQSPQAHKPHDARSPAAPSSPPRSFRRRCFRSFRRWPACAPATPSTEQRMIFMFTPNGDGACRISGRTGAGGGFRDSSASSRRSSRSRTACSRSTASRTKSAATATATCAG